MPLSVFNLAVSLAILQNNKNIPGNTTLADSIVAAFLPNGLGLALPLIVNSQRTGAPPPSGQQPSGQQPSGQQPSGQQSQPGKPDFAQGPVAAWQKIEDRISETEARISEIESSLLEKDKKAKRS
jgi:hypothetical protein